MKTDNTLRLLGGMVAGACLLVAASGFATTINLTVDPNLPPGTTAYVLGAVNPGAPASDANVVQYVNGILGLGLGGSAIVNGNTVYRSGNTFSGLPGSVSAVGAVDGSQSQLTFTMLAGYAFLSAKYDGQNGGTEVWYIGNIPVGTTIVIPSSAFGSGNSQYGLSGTVMFTGGSRVPDGGTTALLLGSALSGLAMIRRCFK